MNKQDQVQSHTKEIEAREQFNLTLEEVIDVITAIRIAGGCNPLLIKRTLMCGHEKAIDVARYLQVTKVIGHPYADRSGYRVLMRNSRLDDVLRELRDE